MRVLVTNDDGIDSPGLLVLARIAMELGHETVVAAPEHEASGTSAGLTASSEHRHLIVRPRNFPDLDGVKGFAVSAHPALIVMVGCQGAFGTKPDIVLSGVNRGANTGRTILHSGTVGAALTAGINGVRAMAVSLDVGLEPADTHHWESTERVVSTLLAQLFDFPDGTVLNVNVPNTPEIEVLATVRATLAEFGEVQSRVKAASEHELQVTPIAVQGEFSPDSDAALLALGHATVTPLRSVSEDTDLKLDLEL